MLYIDNPIGTGFSFCDNGTWVTTNQQLAENFVTFLNIWLFDNECHPEFCNNELYITGESHAGKYIPFIATYVVDYNLNKSNSNHINLVGLTIGNGYNDPIIMYQAAPLYAYNLGIIDLKQLNTVQTEIQSCFDMIDIDPSVATDICTKAIQVIYIK